MPSKPCCVECGREYKVKQNSAEPKKAAGDIAYYQKHTKLIKVF